MRIILVTGGPSNGARALRQAIGAAALIVRAGSLTYRPRPGDIGINWGNSGNITHPRLLNQPVAVGLAVNKLRAFQRMQQGGVPIPEFTTSRAEAIAWRDAGGVVVARQTLTGSEGRGIVISQGQEPVIAAPLYTKHLRHRREYRVHVFQGTVIDVAEKRRRTDFEGERNAFVRSHGNGYVFAHEGVEAPEAVRAASISAVAALGLDFGAVDVGYREREGRAYVFEVNTAPGLENTATINAYASALRSLLQTGARQLPQPRVLPNVLDAPQIPQRRTTDGNGHVGAVGGRRGAVDRRRIRDRRGR